MDPVGRPCSFCARNTVTRYGRTLRGIGQALVKERAQRRHGIGDGPDVGIRG